MSLLPTEHKPRRLVPSRFVKLLLMTALSLTLFLSMPRADAQPDTAWLMGKWIGKEFVGWRAGPHSTELEIVFREERGVVTWTLLQKSHIKDHWVVWEASGTATPSGDVWTLEGSYVAGRPLVHAPVRYELKRDEANNALTGHGLVGVVSNVLLRRVE